MWQGRLGQRGYGPTDELLAGFVPAEQGRAQPGGWNRVVQPRLLPSSLRRLDDHTLLLKLPQLASYDAAMRACTGLSLAGLVFSLRLSQLQRGGYPNPWAATDSAIVNRSSESLAAPREAEK